MTNNYPPGVSGTEPEIVGEEESIFHPYANLQGAYLQEEDLREANLRGVNLQEADLRRANLRGADLQEANLRGVNLQEADLQRADLQEANLRGASLRRADLRGAALPNNVTIIINIGSRRDTLYLIEDRATTGCFDGTLEEFEKRVIRQHANNKHARAYRAALALHRAKMEEE